MNEAKPYPKVTQLQRGPQRKARHRANATGWFEIAAAKRAPCRICGGDRWHIEFHHLIPRAQLGDDVPANIVALCPDCHRGVHLREPAHCRLLLPRLSDDEYAYAVEKLGEGWAERVYGIEYER